MTDDGAGNPRFAFIPKNVWDVLLDLVPIPLACIALWFSVMFVADLVRYLIWASGQFGPLGMAFGMHDAIPTAVAIGITLYFLLDGLLQRHEKARGVNRECFGRSRMLVASATIVVALLAAFWCLDAMNATWPQVKPGGWLKWYTTASVVLGGAWAVGAVTALGLRRFGSRFEAICLLPPIVCLVATLLNAITIAPLAQVAAHAAWLLPGGRGSFWTTRGLLVLVTTFLTVCILPAALWAERKLFHSSLRAIGIACASFWAFVAAMSYWLLSLKEMYSVWQEGCLTMPHSYLEPYFAIGIAGAFALAACVRAWVFSRRRDAMESQAKPADD
jgi:hypothetical protein